MKTLFLLFFLSITTVAQTTVDLSKLSIDKQQQILQIAGQQTTEITPENVVKWVEIGKSIGVAIGSTAKELGVEANTFAQTPLGKFALFLILWKFFGQDLLLLALMLAFLFLILRIGITFYNARYIYTYEDKSYLSGLLTLRKLKEKAYNINYKPRDSEIFITVASFVAGVILMIVTIITVSTM